MRSKVVRFFNVLLIFVFVIALIQVFIVIKSGSITGHSIFNDKLFEIIFLPFVAVFLLGLVVYYLISRDYSSIFRERHIKLRIKQEKKVFEFE